MPSLVLTEDGRSPRVRGPATMTQGRGELKLPYELRELRVDTVTGYLLVGPEYFPHNSIGMYKLEEYASVTRSTFSYYNQHVTTAANMSTEPWWMLEMMLKATKTALTSCCTRKWVCWAVHFRPSCR